MRKIVAISMVKNEMDIIESFVRHTLGFADLLIIADHKSTDRTREILEALQAEGLPLIIEDAAVARYVQAETMTYLLWEAADRYQADLVLPLDADEFLVPTGSMSVRSLLEMLQVDDVRALPWRRYISASDKGIPPGVFALSVQLLRATTTDGGQKALVSGEFVRRKHVRLSEGNHEILVESPEGMQFAHGAFCDGMEIAHFFWRSPEQVQSKFAVSWPNIVAKYSVNTSSGGGYSASFAKICMGQSLERDDGGRTYEACSFVGRTAMPKLRYSAGTVPDVLTNVMAASEALAEELAETRALASHPLVTTIVPYLEGAQLYCGNEPFCASLSSAAAEDYPWREIIVPVIAGSVPEVIQKKVVEAGGRLVTGRPEFLEAVRGKYVEWLLLGAAVRPEKLRPLVTSMELQDLSLPLLFSDAGGQYPAISPCIDFGVPASVNLQMTPCTTMWQYLLTCGKYPSRGLAGLLVRREVFKACGGLLDELAGGKPQMLSMWRNLLAAGAKQSCIAIGILHNDYTGPSVDLRLEDIAAHQLDWNACCRKDYALLSSEEHRDILDRQRRIGIYLLEHAIAEGVDLQSGIWPMYQEMLAEL